MNQNQKSTAPALSTTTTIETKTSTVPETKTVAAPEQKVDGLTAGQYVAKYGTKSSAIRELSKTMTRGQVSKFLGIRYQHVRNVLITPVKAPKVVTVTTTAE